MSHFFGQEGWIEVKDQIPTEGSFLWEDDVTGFVGFGSFDEKGNPSLFSWGGPGRSDAEGNPIYWSFNFDFSHGLTRWKKVERDSFSMFSKTNNENIKSWMEKTGITMYALAKMCNLSRVTIKNLVLGHPARLKTASKLVRATKSMQYPISYKMFPKILGNKKRTSPIQQKSPQKS